MKRRKVVVAPGKSLSAEDVPATVTIAGVTDTGTSSADRLVPGATVHTVCTGKQSDSDVSDVELDDVRPGINAKNVCLMFYMKATSLLLTINVQNRSLYAS